MNKKDLIIIGAGGHGKVCAEIAKQMKKWEKIYFIDNKIVGYVNGIEIISNNYLDEFESNRYVFFVAIGDNHTRKRISEDLLLNNKQIVNLIHSVSMISETVKMGLGNVIMANAIINTSTTIGSGNIINSGSILEHDVVIGNYNHISPNATITGNCSIGNLVWIGASSTLIKGVYIGDNIIIGANSLVNKNILSKGIYFGVPIKLKGEEDGK